MEKDKLTIVAELLAKKYSHAQITEETGIGPSTIARLTRRGRDLGIIPPKHTVSDWSKVNTAVKARGLTRGSIQHMLEALPQEARDWFMDTTPKDTTLAEFAASIIVDAYHEEKGDN